MMLGGKGSRLAILAHGNAGYGPRHSVPSGYRRISRPNRSRKWRSARTYAEARAMSPYPERPVR